MPDSKVYEFAKHIGAQLKENSVSRLALLTAVLLLSGPLSQAQTIAQYDAHLAKLQRSLPEWRAQIEAIDPTKIVVPYHIGKLIDGNKKVLLENLDLVSLYSANIIPAKRSLSAEINLYATVRNVHAGMDDLSSVLLNMVATDQKAAQAWGTQMGDLATGPLNDEQQFEIDALTKFANDLEHRCGSRASPAK